MREFLMRFLRDDEGVAAIEYGLITSLIAVAIIGSLNNVGNGLSQTFVRISSALRVV